MSRTAREIVDELLDAAPVDQPSTYFDKSTFIPSRLGRQLNARGAIQPGPDGRLYRFAGGAFVGDGEEWARAQTRRALGERFRTQHMEQVLGWLKAGEPLRVHTNPDLLNVANGLLEWRTGRLYPHTPEQAGLIQIPHRWNPDAPVATRTDGFLMEVVEGDSIEFVYELLGYGLYPRLPFQNAVLLLGPGGNGKGTLLTIMRALYGAQNTANLTLHALNEDKFARAGLFGKLANLCGDLDARTLERSDIFKQLTGGDPVSAEHKFLRPFDFVNFAKLIFSANQMPPTADQTMGYFDRWLVLPMNRRIRGTTEEIPDLGQDIARSREEMEGVLLAAVNGLRRLMERNRFEVPAAVRAASDGVREEADTVRGFSREELTASPNGWITRAEVYRGYGEWCGANGRRPLSMGQFRPKLLEVFPSVAEGVREGVRGFRGLVLGTSNE